MARSHKSCESKDQNVVDFLIVAAGKLLDVFSSVRIPQSHWLVLHQRLSHWSKQHSFWFTDPSPKMRYDIASLHSWDAVMIYWPFFVQDLTMDCGSSICPTVGMGWMRHDFGQGTVTAPHPHGPVASVRVQGQEAWKPLRGRHLRVRLLRYFDQCKVCNVRDHSNTVSKQEWATFSKIPLLVKHFFADTYLKSITSAGMDWKYLMTKKLGTEWQQVLWICFLFFCLHFWLQMLKMLRMAKASSWKPC